MINPIFIQYLLNVYTLNTYLPQCHVNVDDGGSGVPRCSVVRQPNHLFYPGASKDLLNSIHIFHSLPSSRSSSFHESQQDTPLQTICRRELPRYPSCLLLIVVINSLATLAKCNTWLVILSVQGILSILLMYHIFNASSCFD